MKLVLVNPATPGRLGLNTSPASRHPPLSLASLAALTPKHWEVVVQDENVRPAEFVADADLVGITAFTSTAPRAYEIAAKYRSQRIPVVMGGVHVWARSDEAQQYADSIVLGEAEGVWAGVCRDAEKHRMSAIYFGCKPDVFAVPRRDVLDPSYYIASAATARGCPRTCAFCTVHKFSGNRVRRQRLELVMQDLRSISHHEVFFCDDNFPGDNPKQRLAALDILKGMIDERLNKRFIIQATTRICHDHFFISKLREAGCRVIFIGVETNDPEGLGLVGKGGNILYPFDATEIHKAGMAVLGSFIWGLDTDTPDKLRDRAQYMVDCGADTLQTTIVTPLPGSDLFANMEREGRLLYTDFPNDWSRYDMQELCFVPYGFKSQCEFYDVACKLAESIYSAEQIKSMARRTLSVTACKEAQSVAYMLNAKYRDVMCDEVRRWRQSQ